MNTKPPLLQCLVLTLTAFFSSTLSAQSATIATDFNPNVSGPVVALTLQDDGKILIGGDFQTVGGLAQGRVSRLLVDGSVDTSFNFGTGANGSVNVLLQQPDNKILIAGSFSTFSGTSEQLIARVNADGTNDKF